jgi:hypothetical protein
MLRDDQIVEILELVDFRVNQSWVLFRMKNMPENYMSLGDH